MIAPVKTLLPPDIDFGREFGRLDHRRFAACQRNQYSRVIRPIQQWAEEEIILPTGPREGLKFDTQTQPFAKLLWDEFSNPHWNEYAITGCTQTGKSLLGFAAPITHCLCERQEDAIAAAPTKEILYDKVKRDLFPLIEASRYKDLLPRKGGGSKGGVPDLIELANGAVLKLMSFEGGDKSKASFTCPNIFITEVDGEKASLTSSEAKALEQIVARARATARDKRFILYECTVSFEDGPIWQLVNFKGSASQIMMPCPKCKKYVRPDREDLKGWQDAKSEIEAEKLTAWHCPECNKPWTERQRREANLKAKLVHRGQKIDKRGRIRGPLPETRTLGFRFSAVNNMFLPAADVGVDCWYARENPDEIDAEKKLTQFVFALPYKAPGFEKFKMDREQIEQRKLAYPKGSVPKSSKWITLGVDVGKFRCHWVAIAWLLGKEVRTGLVIDYGTIEMAIYQGEEKITANDVGFDQVFDVAMADWLKRVNHGWLGHEGELIPFDALWIDSRWQGEDDDDVIYDAIREWADPRILPVMGHGKNNYRNSPYRAPRVNPKTGAMGRTATKLGHYYHIDFVPEIMMQRAHVNADAWKLITQQRITTEPDKPGALLLFESKNPREHQTIVKHWESETRERSFEPEKGVTEKWIVKREANHYLDATAYACAAGHHVGFRVSESHRKARTARPTRRGIQGRGGRAWLATQR